MLCTKHPLRKRTDCSDCFPVKPTVELQEPKRVVKSPAKKGKISSATVAAAIETVKSRRREVDVKKLETKFETKLDSVIYKPMIPKLTSCDDVDREIRIEVSKVREYIDTLFGQALEKVRQEVNSIKNIRWEHVNIPLTIFNIELLTSVGKDGWKLVDIMKNPKHYGYPDVPDYVVLQRIVKEDNVPLPDLSKPGNIRKYLERLNGNK